MNNITGEYAAAYQLSEDVVRRVIEAQFTDGWIDHTRNDPGSFVIGRPRATLTPPDRITLRTQATWSSSQASTADYVTADFDAVARLTSSPHSVSLEEAVAHDPATGRPNRQWQDAGIDAVIKPLNFQLFYFSSGEPMARSRVTAVGSGSNRALTLAFDYVEGARDGGQGPLGLFVRDAWALAVSKEEVKARALRSVKEVLGGHLPLPHGNGDEEGQKRKDGSVTIDGGKDIFGTKLKHKLLWLEVDLVQDGLEISGNVDPDWLPEAAFKIPVTLAVQGGKIVATAGEVWVDYDLSVLGEILAAIATQLQQTLRTKAQAAVDGLFDFMRLDPFSARGVVVARPATTGVETGPDAVIAHGSMEIPTFARAPVAQFTVNAFEGGTLMYLERDFDAGGSWAPCGHIVAMEWDFGGVKPTGDELALKRRHSFPQPGHYWVSLKVTDDAGRFAIASQWVTVGILTLEHVNPSGPAWMACSENIPYEAQFKVKCGGDDVKGAMVTCQAGSWKVTHPTLDSGWVFIKIEQVAAGQVLVEAALSGYESDSHVLKAGNCALFQAIRNLAMRAAKALQRWPVPPAPMPGWKEFVTHRAVVAEIVALEMAPDPQVAVVNLGAKLGLKGSPASMVRLLGPMVTRLGVLAKGTGSKPSRVKVFPLD